MIICEYNKNIYQDDAFIIRVINSYKVLFLFKRTVVLSYIMEIHWPKLHINRYKSQAGLHIKKFWEVDTIIIHKNIVTQNVLVL